MQNTVTAACEPAIEMTAEGILFRHYVEIDSRAVAEARRWLQRQADSGTSTDLASWASTVMSLGAQVSALGEATGGVADLAATVAALGQRAEAAGTALTRDVAEASAAAAEQAVSATRKAAEQTVSALVQARQQAAIDLSAAAKAASETMQGELGRLLGGEDALAARAVRDLVRKQMEESEVRVQRALAAVLDRASSAWDPDNPASSVAGLERRLADRQDRQHVLLTANLDMVRESVSAVAASAQTQAAVAAAHSASPAKGRSFEEQVGTALEAVAASMGGSYTATGDSVGALRNCRKGDGVLEVPSFEGRDAVRVVVEMTTTGASRKWGPYIDEAIRNRQAHAAIGIVPSAKFVPGTSALATVGPGRMVMAYDGEVSSSALLNATLVLLVLHAQRDLARDRAGNDTAAADQRLEEAQRQLIDLAETMKAAQGLRSGVNKVIAGVESCHEGLVRSIGQARAAMRAVNQDADGSAAA